MAERGLPADANGPVTGMDAARDALARGAWEEARAAFERELAREETAEALEGLGLTSWWLDRGDGIFETRERSYTLYRERGERASAARLAVWLAWDYAAFRGELAVANGWLRRARRLLDGLPQSPEHAFLALREGVFALLGLLPEDGDAPPREIPLRRDADGRRRPSPRTTLRFGLWRGRGDGRPLPDRPRPAQLRAHRAHL